MTTKTACFRPLPGLFLTATLLASGHILAAYSVPLSPDVSALRFGLCLHYGVDSFARPGEQGQLPAERFAPVSVNVKAWARTAKEAGMTYAILAAKHTSGFGLWDSADYDYDVGNSPFKGDIIGDFIAACEAEGILPGLNYSIHDIHNEGAIRPDSPVPPPYYSVIKRHLTELHTRYRGLRVQRFYGAQRLTVAQWDELSALVQRLNPLCVMLDPQREPQHVIATVIKGWWGRPAAPLFPAPEVFKKYLEAQSLGQGFLLNVGPEPSSRIPDGQLAVLKEVKRLIATTPAQRPARPADPATARLPVAERLKQLKELHQQGLISKDDYDRKVKEIMDAL